MKRSMWKRIKWEKLSITLCAVACAGTWTYAAVEPVFNPPTIVEYHKEIAEGETVWGVCSRIATNDDDLGRLVWETLKLNGIENPGEVQPGRELIVRVKRHE